jgi:hypothetical protein
MSETAKKPVMEKLKLPLLAAFAIATAAICYERFQAGRFSMALMSLGLFFFISLTAARNGTNKPSFTNPKDRLLYIFVLLGTLCFVGAAILDKP